MADRRTRISAAAFSVKVSATSRGSGTPLPSLPPANRENRMRSMSKVVLPVPAPASTTMFLPSSVRALSRCSWSALMP